MDLRQMLIEESNKKDVSEPFDYSEIVKGVRFLKVDTKTGEKIAKMSQVAQAEKDLEGLTAKMLVKMICEEDGTRTLKDSDIGVIDSIQSAITSEMLQDALIFNKIIKGAIKETIKN